MQKLVAGEISKEHDVAAALRELLSMEDFSHGCLEIFAPTIKGLIGISDNREIVAAQISNEGPTGLKALRLLLTVRQGRYAFREGYRVSGSQGLSIKRQDLEALIKGFSNAITGEMPEANGTAAGDAPANEQGAAGSQKTKKGIDAVARMKAAIQTRTGTNFPAIQLEESISRLSAPTTLPTADEPSVDTSAKSEPQATPAPISKAATEAELETTAVDEPYSESEASAELETKTEPKSKTNTWSDLLSDNNVASVRSRNTTESPTAGKENLPETESTAEPAGKAAIAETPQISSPAKPEPQDASAKDANAKISQPIVGTTGGAAANVSSVREVTPPAGTATPKLPVKKSWAAEQLARRAASTRTGITGHNIPAMQAQTEKLTRTGDQARIEAISETKESDAKEVAAEKGANQSTPTSPAVAKTSEVPAASEIKGKLSDLKAKLSASSGKTTAASAKSPDAETKSSDAEAKPDAAAKSTNPRNTSNLLAALKSKSEVEETEQQVKLAKAEAREKENDPRRTRTIEIHSAQASEKKQKERVRQYAKYAIGAVAAAIGLGVLVCLGLYIDEQARVAQVNALYAKNDHKGAVAMADEALKLHPNSAKLLDSRGHSLEKLGKTKEALQDFEAAFNVDSNNLDILKHRAYGYALNRKYQQALDDYNRLFQDKSYLRPALLRCRANVFLSLGRYADAEKDLQAVGHMGTPTKEDLLLESMCEAQMGHFPKSEDLINQVLKHDPNNIAALMQRSSNFLKQKKRKEAKDILNKVLAIRPTPEAYLQLADMARLDKNVHEEIACYSKYLNLRPNDRNILTAVAALNLSLGKLDLALSEVNKIEKTNDISSDTEFYTLRADIESRMGNLDRAFLDRKKAREISPEDWWTNANLAQTAEKSGNYSTAADAYTFFIIRHPKDIQWLLKRGNAYMLFKKYELAAADFDKAILIEPGSKEAYYKRGMYCYNQGQYDRAAVDFEQALRLDRNYAEAKKMRQQIARMKGSHGEIASSDRVPFEPPEKDLTASKSERELIDKGYELLKEGNSSSAIKYFVQVVKLNPNSVEGRRYLAFACISDGNTKTALEQYAALDKLNALKDEDRSQFVEALTSAGRIKEAAALLLGMVTAHPDDADLRIKLAQTYLSENDMVKFQDVCKEGMKVAKSTEDYERLRTLLLNTLKNRDRSNTEEENLQKNRSDAGKISG